MRAEYRLKARHFGALVALVLAGCGDLVLQALEALGEAPITEVRISGAGFITLASKKDSADRISFDNGYLCVKHSPGCGIVGNSGTDKFFGTGKPLPLLAQIVGVEFAPTALGVPGGLGGWGSFGADLKTGSADGQTATTVNWSNACQGPNAAKDLYYRVSFRVRIRGDVSQLGEPTVDASARPTAGCGDAPGPRPPPAPMASGLLGVVKYCNPTTQQTGGTLTLTAACSPAQPGTQFSCTMTESLPISFLPSRGGQPSTTSFMTKQIYQQGGWTITKAEVRGLTGSLQALPLSIQVPGGVGTPVLDFSGGACG